MASVTRGHEAPVPMRLFIAAALFASARMRVAVFCMSFVLGGLQAYADSSDWYFADAVTPSSS